VVFAAANGMTTRTARNRGEGDVIRSRGASAPRSRSARRTTLRWIIAGGAIAIAIHFGVGWSTRVAAQAGPVGGETTFSVTSDYFFFTESPPACSVLGSTRVVTSPPTVTNSLGPKCIGIGDREDPVTGAPNVITDTSACLGAPAAAPPIDPTRGQLFYVAPGDNDIDVHTRYDTYACVAAVPALSRPMIVALALLKLGTGAWFLRRRTA
jgi:hypothetical protein